MLIAPASQGSERNASLGSCLDSVTCFFPAHRSVAVPQLIRHMSLHAMAFIVLSSFPMCSGGGKKSPFILQCRQLETPCGDKAAAAAGGLHAPAPHCHSPVPSQTTQSALAKLSWHLTTRSRAGGDISSAPNSTCHPGHNEPELGAIFPFTAVMKLQSKWDGSEKQRSSYASPVCLAL